MHQSGDFYLHVPLIAMHLFHRIQIRLRKGSTTSQFSIEIIKNHFPVRWAIPWLCSDKGSHLRHGASSLDRRRVASAHRGLWQSVAAAKFFMDRVQFEFQSNVGPSLSWSIKDSIHSYILSITGADFVLIATNIRAAICWLLTMQGWTRSPPRAGALPEVRSVPVLCVLTQPN